MPDGSTPATAGKLIQLLDRADDLIQRADYLEAVALIREAKQLAEYALTEAKAKQNQIASGGAVPQKSSEPAVETRSEIAEALSDYQWATIEAKNILHCISFAVNQGHDEPAIDCAIDGVARLLALVNDKWNGVESAAREEVSHA